MITAIIIIGLIVLIIAHEFGHFIAAKIFDVRVDEFGLGYPPKLFGKKIGETEYTINLIPLGGFVRIHGEDEEDEHRKDEVVDSLSVGRRFTDKAVWKRAIILVAGVTMNLIVAWLLIVGILMVGSPEHLAVAEVAKNSPAAVAGISAGDFITHAKLNDKVFTDPIKSDEYVSAVRSNAGSDISVTVLHAGKEKIITINSRKEPPQGEGPTGMTVVDAGMKQQSFFPALYNGLIGTAALFWLTLSGFFGLIAGLFTASGSALSNIAGPVGVFSIASQTGKMGLIYLFQLISVISINLAVMNLIPFPALDGGRVLFLIIEKLKGSPVSYKTQRTMNAIGFALLILLMVFVTMHDIRSILR